MFGSFLVGREERDGVGRERARLVAGFGNISYAGHGWMRQVSPEPVWFCLTGGNWYLLLTGKSIMVTLKRTGDNEK